MYKYFSAIYRQKYKLHFQPFIGVRFSLGLNPDPGKVLEPQPGDQANDQKSATNVSTCDDKIGNDFDPNNI